LINWCLTPRELEIIEDENKYNNTLYIYLSNRNEEWRDQCRLRPVDATGGSRLGFILFNATFNNISAIILYLLVEETGVPRENHRPVASH
jgi:hypothetical protein